MFLTRTQWLIIGGGLVIAVIVAGLIFFFGAKNITQAELTLWGLDPAAVWQPIFDEYKKENPGIEINYIQKNPQNYERDLVNALASNQGPDLLFFQNSWLPKHFDKIAPAPPQLIDPAAIRQLYPSVVEQDLVAFDQVFSLPLFIDSLALFYNQDIFDQRKIALPPANWLEFQELARQLGFGKTAIGGSNSNIDGATDILNALMLQEGVTMTNEKLKLIFADEGGLAPLLFYSKFSQPQSDYYVWNQNQPFSPQGFSRGEIAMMIGYHYHANLLQRLNPSLRFAIASLPQSAATVVNYPFYYGLAVSGQSPNYQAAWQFIVWLTTNPEASLQYLAQAGQPPALRSLIGQFSNDPEFGLFANQALTARSWPQFDNLAVENVFSQMLESIMEGGDAETALKAAQNQLNGLLGPAY